MPAGVYDFTVEQGADWSRLLTIKTGSGAPLDLTGYTGRAQIRKKHSSPAPAASMTVTFNADRTSGEMTLSLSSMDTAAIPAGESAESSASQYVWDFEIEKGGSVIRVLQGSVAISPEATR